ncbi:MAG: hypothetical protein O6761_00315 [Thaumarchaeota archaeon]|nr:hypothetical protein [Nitrososphaerota archaeon]
MGIVDIDSLFRVNDKLKKIIKQHELPFSFKVDAGTYETAIEFVGSKPYHPPLSQDWSTHPVIFCPDLLDWENKIIIEFEEEVGNRRPGAKLARKGHNREGDMDNKRDTRRTGYYKHGGFHTLRIWESDNMWESKLETFIISLVVQ